MISGLKRWAIIVKDRIRYARVLYWLTGCFFALKGWFASNPKDRLSHFAKAFRLLAPLGKGAWVQEKLRPFVEDQARVAIWREERIGWGTVGRGLSEFEISKGLILKPYVNPDEKGVIMISFEYNWLPLLALSRSSELFKHYALICAPSWSPPPFPTIWSMAGVPEADVFVMQSNFREANWYSRLPTNVTALPLLISHWIHPDYYEPRPHSERDIDILMVANWATFKRHWVLFRALRELPDSYRVVLVGQPDSGRTMANIEAEAEAFGVRDRIEIMECLSIEEVTSLQCRSKASLVFSRREGSCVVVAESMFADCPVALLEGAHIGSSAFVNPETGVHLSESQLAMGLKELVSKSSGYSPRKWAMDHISCFRSIEILNQSLREWSESNGKNWTQDVVPFMCRPNPVYLDAAQESMMAPSYQRLFDLSAMSLS